LSHPLDDFKLPPELVKLLVRAFLYQDGLREVGRIDYDDLRAQRDHHETNGEQDD
jgi:hypothetical protein